MFYFKFAEPSLNLPLRSECAWFSKSISDQRGPQTQQGPGQLQCAKKITWQHTVGEVSFLASQHAPGVSCACHDAREDKNDSRNFMKERKKEREGERETEKVRDRE